MSVEELHLIKSQKIWDIDEIEIILKKCTIFDKIEFSGISKEAIQEKIKDLETRQVPNRDVLLDMDNAKLAEYWFKNWLHPMLKHCVARSPSDKKGCSERVLKMDMKRDCLHTYENGQQNFDYSLEDVKNWIK